MKTAVEYGHFILDCIIGLLYDTATPEWLKEVASFFSAIRRLFDSFTKNNLKEIRDQIDETLSQWEDLFPSIKESINIHQIAHLPFFAEWWGPLNYFSSFAFERQICFNNRHLHGTRGYLSQLGFHLAVSDFLEM
jgi:hypothetical protein